MNTTTYKVMGMTCGHCAAAVTEEVSQIPGVRNVEVDLPQGAVTVTSERALDEAVVASAVGDAGYELAGEHGDTR